VGVLPYALGLLIALVLSAQLLLLMERDRPLAKRLRDLSTGGDAFSILFAAFLTLGTLGALLGSLLHAPAPGAATGLTLALLTWITAVVQAHRRPQPPARHSAPDER